MEYPWGNIPLNHDTVSGVILYNFLHYFRVNIIFIASWVRLSVTETENRPCNTKVPQMADTQGNKTKISIIIYDLLRLQYQDEQGARALYKVYVQQQ